MKLMILDGNSVINRAFYGVRPLTTRDGLYTNAIFGFLNILQKVTAEEAPDALCVAFDLHGPTFRHLKYDGYKATRHPMPEELAMQMPVMKQVLAAMNIPVYACEGWEADDVLGTVGRLCEEAGWDCAILTGDRDSLQLVDEHVSVRLVHTQGGQTQIVLHFQRRQHIGIDLLWLGVVERSGGVIAHQTIPHGLVQALLKQAVDVPHGFFAQAGVSGAMITEATPFLQKFSDHLRCQFRERYIPQAGEDMVLKYIVVCRIGGRSTLILVIGFLPEDDVFPKRHIPTSMHWRCRSRKATHGSRARFNIFLCR